MSDIPISDIKLLADIFDMEQTAAHPNLIYRSATEFIFVEKLKWCNEDHCQKLLISQICTSVLSCHTSYSYLSKVTDVNLEEQIVC